MKLVLLSVVVFLFMVSCGTKSEVVSSDPETPQELVAQSSESAENPPYKVLGGASTAKFNVYKRGLGNKILFEASFPTGMEMYFSSGNSVRKGKYRGVEHVNFPVTCSFYCPTVSKNWNSDMASQLNDFKIEFYEPGNWYVVFTR